MADGISPDDERVIRACLLAVVDSPWFDDRDFHTIFGLTRDQLGRIANAWPAVDQRSPDVQTAVSNALNNLTGYPLGEADLAQWDQYVPVSRDELVALFADWSGRARASW